MSDATVKIRVEAEAKLDPLEKARAELKKLRAEQREMEGMGAKKAAAEVGRRADRLERNIDAEGRRRLRVEDDEARRAAKEKAQADREATKAMRESAREEKTRERATRQAAAAVGREEREQAAMRKAGVTRFGRAANAVGNLAQAQNVGGGAGQAMMAAGMRTGNPVAMAATAIAAAVVGFATMRANQKYEDGQRELRVKAAGSEGAYQIHRNRGIHGSSGALVSHALNADEEIFRRKADRHAISDREEERWNAPSTWKWFGLRKNAGEKEREENEAQIERLEKEAARARQAAREKYMQEEGGLELKMLRGRAARTQEGQQQAFAAQMGATWLAKYKETMAASDDAGMAKEMADLTVENELRDRQAMAGAGLVDAHTGGAGIAAAARWATQTFNADAVGAEVRNLTHIVQQGNQAAQTVNHAK